MSTNCIQCRGRGTIRCDECGGRGGRWAHRYQPVGFNYRSFDFRMQWESCVYCEGGRMTCPTCYGDGQRETVPTRTTPPMIDRAGIKEIARVRALEILTNCPLCSASIKPKNLVMHFDKNHATVTQ